MHDDGGAFSGELENLMRWVSGAGILLGLASAVILILVPFTVERVDDARLAVATVQAASGARDVSRLVQELQDERLVALGYLSVPTVDPPTQYSRRRG